MQITNGPKFPKTYIGEVIIHNGRVYRRGRGIYYTAQFGGVDPTILRAYLKREKKRQRRK